MTTIKRAKSQVRGQTANINTDYCVARSYTRSVELCGADAAKEWKASPRLVPTYFPRPSGDEREAQWMEWHGLEPPSSGYDRPPEVANADVGGVGEWELAGA